MVMVIYITITYSIFDRFSNGLVYVRDVVMTLHNYE